MAIQFSKESEEEQLNLKASSSIKGTPRGHVRNVKSHVLSLELVRVHSIVNSPLSMVELDAAKVKELVYHLLLSSIGSFFSLILFYCLVMSRRE